MSLMMVGKVKITMTTIAADNIKTMPNIVDHLFGLVR